MENEYGLKFGSKLGSIASIVLLVAVLAGVGVVFWLAPARQAFAVPLWACVFLAFVTPFTIIAIRHQVRRNRVKLIELFSQSFKLEPDGSDLVSFEFVRGKYFADLDTPKFHKELTIEAIPRFPMMLHADWMLLFCAVPYMIFSGFGIFVLLSPLDQVIPPGILSDWLTPTMLSSGGLAGDMPAAERLAFFVNVVTISAIAYAGAYFYTLKLFLSAVTAFDLSPITFLRAFAHMVLSVTLAVVLYRAMPTLAGVWNKPAEFLDLPAVDTFKPSAGLGAQWYVLSFAFGYFPDFVLDRLVRMVDYPFKRRYTAIERHSPQVPLTVIDGIDAAVAYRLEEANIYDVQNLATFNPIMLHIESPYGIYETVDWIAQAQLCSVVGPDRFLMLKTLNIRTIFDLERAVLANGASPELRKSVGAILLTDHARDKAMRNALFDQAAAAVAAGSLSESAIVGLAEVMLDDLHVYRLRQIWDKIKAKIDGPRRWERFKPDGDRKDAPKAGPNGQEGPVRPNGRGRPQRGGEPAPGS